MANRKTLVRFVFGPYDGLEFHSECGVGDLAPVIVLPVSQNVLRALNGCPIGPLVAVQVVAIYVGERAEHSVSYRLASLRPVCPGELQELENWCDTVARVTDHGSAGEAG